MAYIPCSDRLAHAADLMRGILNLRMRMRLPRVGDEEGGVICTYLYGCFGSRWAGQARYQAIGGSGRYLKHCDCEE